MSKIDAMEQRAAKARQAFHQSLADLRDELSVGAVLTEIARQGEIRFGLIAKARGEVKKRPVAAGLAVLAVMLVTGAHRYRRRPADPGGGAGRTAVH